METKLRTSARYSIISKLAPSQDERSLRIVSSAPIIPYIYQCECLDALQAGLVAGDRRQSIVMATGLGKTIAAVLALKERLKIMPGRVGIFCHQRHILDQWEKALRLVFGDSLSYGRFHSFAPRGQNATAMLGLFQSMAHNLEDFPPNHFRHLVVDESHHAPARTYRPTIEHFASYAQLLGLTATPNRADRRDIKEIFGYPTFELPLELALAKGYLVRVRYFLLSDGIQNLDKIPTNMGTLSRSALNRLFFTPERDERIVELIIQNTDHLGDALRMMAFCRNIAHAERYERLLPNAWAVHSDIRPRAQDRRIADYIEGEKTTLVTVNKFNEGVDYPDTNVVALLREHGTETGYLQQIGRALRPVPGKEEVLILDVAGNCERLELIAALRDKVRTIYDDLQRASDAEQTTPPPFEATVGSFEFDVQLRQVLEILATIRPRAYRRFTDDSMLELLRQKAGAKGVAPKVEEVNNDPEMPSVPAYVYRYGSWPGAIKAAGLRRRTDRQVIIEQLKRKAGPSGVAPTTREVDADPDMVSANSVILEFGTWNNAIQEAQLKPRHIPNAKNVAELTQDLLAKAQALGRTPTGPEVDADPGMMSVQAYKRAFGVTWNEILAQVGLPPTRKRSK